VSDENPTVEEWSWQNVLLTANEAAWLNRNDERCEFCGHLLIFHQPINNEEGYEFCLVPGCQCEELKDQERRRRWESYKQNEPVLIKLRDEEREFAAAASRPSEYVGWHRAQVHICAVEAAA
jgi:hypothetical protein